MTSALQDHKEREQIVTAHSMNLFVDAGAGSGKTKQLVDRVVAMIASGATQLPSIANLAAITFTENAATELRTRVRERLEQASLDQTRPEIERNRCKLAVDNFNDAAITTLHGFASRLLMDAPLEAGLPPGFRVQDAVQTSLARADWWSLLLDEWYADPSLADVWQVGLTLGLNPNYLREVAAVFDNNWDLLSEKQIVISSAPTLDSAAILEPIRDVIRYAPPGAEPEGDTLTSLIEDVLVPLLRDAEVETDPLQVLAVLQGTRLSTKAGNAGKWKAVGLDKAVITGLLDQAEAARSTQLTQSRAFVTTTLVARLSDAVIQHADRRRDTGELWFHDLLVRARDLLKSDREIRLRMHKQWQVICVDEFQDTDPLQVALVHLIAGLGHDDWRDAEIEGGRLFFVGDPKQSIYRFRRAEVELFGEVRDGHAEEANLGLVQNFRSRAQIIATVNEIFDTLFRDNAVIGYRPLISARPPVANDPGPDVLLIGGPSPDRISDIREVEAGHVTACLARAKGTWLVTDRDGDNHETHRPASYGDMAILVPTRTSLGQMESALDDRGIPYRIMSRSLIWESDAVRDLITVLQAIDDPSDSVALVAALRHPMLGCSDDDLVAWKVAGGPWRYDAPTPDGAETLAVAEAMAVLRRYHDLRWWLPVNVLLDRILRERRAVELTMIHRRPRDHWRRLRFVVDQSRSFLDSGGRCLTDFVRWAQEQIETAADAIETVTPERDDDAVQILTIHGSKGLEFPIVALSGINAGPNNRAHVVWGDDDVEVNLYKGFSSPGFGAAKSREDQLGGEEDQRVLYVAMTRAADHLIVSMHHHEPKGGASNCHAMSLYQTLSRLTEVGAVHEAAASPNASHTPSDERPAAEPIDLSARQAFIADRQALLGRATRMSPTTATGLAKVEAHEPAPGGADDQEPSDPLTDHDQPSAEPAAPRPIAASGATLGSAVHRALELLDLTDPADTAISQASTAACLELGIPRLVSPVRERVAAALGSPIVQAAKNSRHWKEVPIVAQLRGRIVEGFIDLVVETSNGLVVVDYKTDANPSDATLAAYRKQIGVYAEALAAATGHTVADQLLVFCRPGREATVAFSDLPDADVVLVNPPYGTTE